MNSNIETNNPLPVAATLEEIREQVDARRALGGFLSRSRIILTSKYGRSHRTGPVPGSQEFRPNATRAVLVAALTGAAVYVALFSFLSRHRPGALAFAAATGLLLAALTYFIVRRTTATVTLNLDRRGIAIDGDLVPWANIRETAILSQPHGKTTRRYLVLWLRNGSYQLVDLSCFFRFRIGGFAGELAACINDFRMEALP
ncbi:MAG: hypothetical protein EOO11_00580 [Chitinophagaceae bacterium]|nr:MAG: hypothetical protein EOO11_00580 [Chitinophagaceae bacterium]